MSERERQVMKKLKEVVDKQRDEIRAKDRELGLKNEDVEAVSDQSQPCVLSLGGPLLPFSPFLFIPGPHGEGTLRSTWKALIPVVAGAA